MGAHDVRFGGSYTRFLDNRTFGAFETSAETLGTTLGNALDNLMIGQIRQFQGAVDPQGHFPGETVSLPLSAPSFERSNRYNEWAVYVTDAWRPAVRLTLNLSASTQILAFRGDTGPGDGAVQGDGQRRIQLGLRLISSSKHPRVGGVSRPRPTPTPGRGPAPLFQRPAEDPAPHSVESRVRVESATDRHTHIDSGALVELRADRNLTLHDPRALLDAHQTQPAVLAGASDIKTYTVVNNRQRQRIIAACESHGGVLRTSMSCGVSECFLRNAKQRQRYGWNRGLDVPLRAELHLDVVVTLDFDAVRLEGRNEPDMLEHARMKVMGEEPKRFGNAGHTRVNRGERLSNGDIPDIASVHEIADVDGNPRHLLARIVVQVARDARAFRLLCCNEPAGEILNLSVTRAEHVLALFAFRDLRFERRRRRSMLLTRQAKAPAAHPATSANASPRNHQVVHHAGVMISAIARPAGFHTPSALADATRNTYLLGTRFV
jgi:hypothetical protein